MSSHPEDTRWLCHVCGYSSNQGEGQACCLCYKITCRQHLHIATVHNPDSGLYELKQVCAECQLRGTLS